MPMHLRATAATTGALAALAIGLPSALAAPASDDRGYLNSTARCTEPSSVAVFGSTANSRIAICKSTDGDYEYRGVRVDDGARLIIPAKASGDDTYVADNGEISYLVSAKSLVVSKGNTVMREEPMVDFHGPATPAAAPATPTSTTPLPPPLPAEQGGG